MYTLSFEPFDNTPQPLPDAYPTNELTKSPELDREGKASKQARCLIRQSTSYGRGREHVRNSRLQNP
jgi:hypothetical protein